MPLVMGSSAVESHQKAAEVLFAAVGRVIIVSEKEIDAVTAVSGCGPAYLAIVLEALADGGVKMGLSRQVALELAAQTMIGTGRMVLNGEHPAVLKDRVCSPGREHNQRCPCIGEGRFAGCFAQCCGSRGQTLRRTAVNLRGGRLRDGFNIYYFDYFLGY